MSDIERVSTGVPGLDSLIDGGIIKSHAMLVTGYAGTGKTIFCSQFLWEGLRNGENCMFITFEERPDKIKRSAKDFGWDFEKYEEKGQLIIKYKEPVQGSSPGEDLFWFRNELEKHDIDRIVLDSTSILSLYFDDQFEVREKLFHLVRILEESGATSILTTEAPQGKDKITRFGVEEFLVDGVIFLDYVAVGPQAGRSMTIKKMRRTDFDENRHPIEISDEGLQVMNI